MRPAPGVRAAPDATPADWLDPRLMVWGTQEGTPVGAVVPADYAAYARILHPAVGRDEAHDAPSLPWSVVAAWSGRGMHPEVQWERLIAPAGRTDRPPPWSHGPVLGHLPAVVARPLVAVLRAHTVSPQRCWLCVWEGGAAGWTTRLTPPESSSRTAATGS